MPGISGVRLNSKESVYHHLRTVYIIDIIRTSIISVFTTASNSIHLQYE